MIKYRAFTQSANANGPAALDGAGVMFFFGLTGLTILDKFSFFDGSVCVCARARETSKHRYVMCVFVCGWPDVSSDKHALFSSSDLVHIHMCCLNINTNSHAGYCCWLCERIFYAAFAFQMQCKYMQLLHIFYTHLILGVHVHVHCALVLISKLRRIHLVHILYCTHYVVVCVCVCVCQRMPHCLCEHDCAFMRGHIPVIYLTCRVLFSS